MTINISLAISVITLIIGMFIIIKIVEKGILKLIKRKRAEWENEIKKNKHEYKNYEINTINSDKGNLYESLYINNKKIDTTNIAKHFNISTKEINKIFSDLKWVEQSGKWEIATRLGIRNGAEEKYNAITRQKYVIWDEEIKNNIELINALNVFKESKNIKTKMTDEEKKEKGDKYEAYVAEHYRKQGYTVWEHGKEKGDKDGGIDLLVKKGKEALFVQCKDWENYKINDKIVKATQTDVRNYMLENPVLTSLLNECEKRIMYVTSRECLTKGAYTYIENNSHIIGYEVIPTPKI